jgi:hypothetical protein
MCGELNKVRHQGIPYQIHAKEAAGEAGIVPSLHRDTDLMLGVAGFHSSSRTEMGEI